MPAERVSLRVRGVVQGVGFRPFVHRLANELGLAGWVRNETDGVRIEIEGTGAAIAAFDEALEGRPPPGAVLCDIERRAVAPEGARTFAILESAPASSFAASLPPDTAPCDACAREIATPGERRRRYPFTNCTRCGPRYTIVDELPYDRARTTLRGFPLCDACAREYADPADRRFHAEAMACPACGPRVRALDPRGVVIAEDDRALALVTARLREGDVCALKGVGGYQLLADATRDEPVARLRRRKRREEKPFAVMFPSLDDVRRACIVSDREAAILASPEAPILLVRRAPGSPIAPAVAPGSPWIGAMLPSSPLHRLLLGDVARPLVCTSGNLSNEPLCTDDADALARLGSFDVRGSGSEQAGPPPRAPIADLFLVHDRPIARPVDDSLARLGPTGLELLRRARGFVPRTLPRPGGGPTILALGGHLKSTLALAAGPEIVLSQHLGDLDSPLATSLLERTADDLLHFLHRRPDLLACDLHPDYASTRLAELLAARFGAPIERIQHHHAHIAACIAEHSIEGPVLGLAWDGIGYGEDGDLWGGEALVCEGARAPRFAHLRPFRLPGGEVAIREPRRSALGLLHAMGGEEFASMAREWFAPGEIGVLERMLERGFNAPRTTSMGRLFDAVAAIAGVRLQTSFEGQAAMELEDAADGAGEANPYEFGIREGMPLIVDWEPMVRAMLDERRRGAAAAGMSARFHATLAAMAVAIARRAGLSSVALGGGCFQNRRLAGLVRRNLEEAGFRVWSPAAVPPNDGGLSLGQAWVAARR